MKNKRYLVAIACLVAAAHPASAMSQEPPRIFAGTNGEIEATYTNNCVVYYDASGRQTQSNANCSSDQVRRADIGVEAYRREQGLDGYAGSEAPPGGFGAPSTDIHLTCFGEGERPDVRTYPTLRWDRREHEFDTRYRSIITDESFNSMVQIEIIGNEGYIWLPNDLQPPIHSGGDHGWWEIRNMEVTSYQITGRYRLNGLNRPRVTLDRRTNWLEIRGQRGFEGYCEPSE